MFLFVCFIPSSPLHIYTFVEFKLKELLTQEKKAAGICFLKRMYKDSVYRKKNLLIVSNPNSLNFCISLEECVRQKLSFYSRTKSNY